jgi:hypothetical protein
MVCSCCINLYLEIFSQSCCPIPCYLRVSIIALSWSQLSNPCSMIIFPFTLNPFSSPFCPFFILLFASFLSFFFFFSLSLPPSPTVCLVVNADVKFNDSDPLNLPESLGGRRKSSAGSPPEGETPKPEAEPGPSTSSTFMQIANNTLDPQLESFFTSTFSLLPFFDLPQSSSRLKASSFYKKVLVPFKEMYAGPKIQEFLQLPEIKALNLPTGDILDFKKHKARGASKKAQEALVAVRKTLAAAVMYLAINYATSPRKGGVAGICYVKAVGTSALTSDLDFNAFGPCAIPVALFVSYAFNVLFDDLAADGVCGVSGGPSCSAHVFDVNIYETGGFQYRLKSIAPSDPVITARLAAKYTEVYNKLLESGESTGDYDSFGFSVNYDASEDEKDYLPFSGFKSSSFNPWYQLEYTLLMFATLKVCTKQNKKEN